MLETFFLGCAFQKTYFLSIFEFQKFLTPADPPSGPLKSDRFTDFHKKWLKIVIFGSMCCKMAP